MLLWNYRLTWSILIIDLNFYINLICKNSHFQYESYLHKLTSLNLRKRDGSFFSVSTVQRCFASIHHCHWLSGSSDSLCRCHLEEVSETKKTVPPYPLFTPIISTRIWLRSSGKLQRNRIENWSDSYKIRLYKLYSVIQQIVQQKLIIRRNKFIRFIMGMQQEDMFAFRRI